MCYDCITGKLRVSLKMKTKQRYFYVCLASLSDEKSDEKLKNKETKAYFIMVV